MDFKVAMHTVLLEAFPSATIKCCRFHLWAKHGGGRSKLSGLVLILDIMPDCAHYLLENYVTSDSTFTPDIWAGIPSEEKRLTNNSTESFHPHFNEQSKHLIQPFSYFTSCI